MGQVISAAVAELCHSSLAMAADSVQTQAWLCSNKSLFTKAGQGPDLALLQFTDPRLGWVMGGSDLPRMGQVELF